MKWFVKCWKQYADFSGRARRQEFWMFRLFHVLVIVVFLMLNNLLVFWSMASVALMERLESAGAVALTERPESAGAVGILIGAVTALCVLYCLAALIPSLAVGVRRLHDSGNSGWMMLVGLIPLVGGIWLLVLFCQDSQPGANRWGANPKE